MKRLYRCWCPIQPGMYWTRGAIELEVQTMHYAAVAKVKQHQHHNPFKPSAETSNAETKQYLNKYIFYNHMKTNTTSKEPMQNID